MDKIYSGKGDFVKMGPLPAPGMPGTIRVSGKIGKKA
jgi:hypothetical protein